MIMLVQPSAPAVLLDGRGAWEKIDRQGRTVQSGHGHNLLLNAGLNRLPVVGLPNGLQGSFGSSGFLGYWAVGDGAGGEPAVGDTALVNEIARTGTTVGTPTLTRISDGVYRYVVVKELDFNQGNGNLSEWAFSDSQAAGANIAVREKFRGADGTTPVTVTKTSEYKLRMTYTFETHLTPVVATAANFTLAGAASPQAVTNAGTTTTLINGKYLLTGDLPFLGAVDYLTVSEMMKGSAAAAIVTGRGATPNPAYATVLSRDGGAYTLEAASSTKELTFDAYVPGSFQRTARIAYGTADANKTIYGWEIGPSAYYLVQAGDQRQYQGYLYLTDPGYEITLKDNLKTLTITGFGVSFGRYP